MQETIDSLFSSVLFMTIFILVEMFFFIWLSFKSPFSSNSLNKVYKAMMFIIPCAIMALPAFTYFGFSNDFKQMTMGDKTICLFEEYERGGENGDENVCRLHILDKKTGQKKERFYIGDRGDLIAQQGDLVCYNYNHELNVYNTMTRKTIYSIAKDDWASQFDELKTGIESIDNRGSGAPTEKTFIRLTCKDGNKYWFEPFEKKLFAAEPKQPYQPGFYCTGYELKYQNKNGVGNYVLSFGYIEGSKRKKIIVTPSNEINITGSEEKSYLEPTYLGIDTLNHVFIFAHFMSTDKTDFLIEAKNFQLKTIWKKTKTELAVEDSYSSNEFDFSVNRLENEILYFNISGFLLAIKTKTGEISWKTRN